uniref:4Fe-4S ferredoxin-type domain-containing protein n=1 Tax=Setaria italica TaxID=4555 RepID=K3YAN7_SETIT
MGVTSRVNVMVILVVVLFACLLASTYCRGDRPVLGEVESTRRNYNVATNHTLADDPNGSDGNSSNIVTVFCVKENCRQSTCYCCNTNQPKPCFQSWDACRQNCRTCAPRCPSSQPLPSDVQGLRSLSIGNAAYIVSD